MSRRTQAIWLGVATGLWVVALPLIVGFAGLSVMISDAGVNWAVWTAILLAFAWPVIVVLGPIGGWIAYAVRRPRVAAAFTLAPAAWPIVMLIGWIVLQNFMGGRR